MDLLSRLIIQVRACLGLGTNCATHNQYQCDLSTKRSCAVFPWKKSHSTWAAGFGLFWEFLGPCLPAISWACISADLSAYPRSYAKRLPQNLSTREHLVSVLEIAGIVSGTYFMFVNYDPVGIGIVADYRVGSSNQSCTLPQPSTDVRHALAGLAASQRNWNRLWGTAGHVQERAPTEQTTKRRGLRFCHIELTLFVYILQKCTCFGKLT